MQKRAPRKRRRFTEEFKAETVRLVREGRKSPTLVARDLDLTKSAVERWVRQADIEAGRGPAAANKPTPAFRSQPRAAAREV